MRLTKRIDDGLPRVIAHAAASQFVVGFGSRLIVDYFHPAGFQNLPRLTAHGCKELPLMIPSSGSYFDLEPEKKDRFGLIQVRVHNNNKENLRDLVVTRRR